jgi:TolA protein
MTAPEFLFYSPLAGSRGAEPKLAWMVVLSCVIHGIAFAVFMGMPHSLSRDTYYSPVYSVDLVGLPPGPPAAKSQGQATTGRTAEVVKQHVKLWKGPSLIESQGKTQAERSHPVLTIPAKAKEPAAGRAEQEPDSRTAPEMPADKAAESAAPVQQERSPGVPGGTGGGGGAADLRFGRYYQSLYEKIYQAWTLPDYGMEKEGSREAIIVIKVQRDGKILGAAFEKMSGNRQLDASAMNAIKKADPLPPLPDDFRENFLEIGIRFIPQQKAP